MFSKEVFYDWFGLNQWLLLKVYALSSNEPYVIIMRLITLLGSRFYLHWWLAAIALIAILDILVRRVRHEPRTYHYLMGWVGVFLVIGVTYVCYDYLLDFMKGHFAYPRPYVDLSLTVNQL